MFRTLAETRKALLSGDVTLQEIVNQYVSRIDAFKKHNIFLEVFEDEAFERARELDQKLKSGEKTGKLFGLVIGIKDNLSYKGHKVSASSKILEGYTSIYNSTVVERLLAEDAIIIGRLNCDEFAMGSSNENSAFGPVLNPLDTNRVSGGSSGGSAAAIAAGLCMATLGTDTGGSIRQPASFCGVVGIKPSYGRVSRYGCIAYASSFDQIGPLAQTVEDCAAVLEVIAGKDEYDSTVSSKPVPAYSELLGQPKKYRIAYLKETIDSPGLDNEIRTQTYEWIERLKNEGHTVESVDFPLLDYLIPSYYVLTTAEASSNLARYDGIHYGYRSPKATDLESTYKLSRSEGFGKEVKRRIMLGSFVLSSGYYDAYYGKAQKVRRLIREKTLEILGQYDFILTPSTPGTAFEIGAKTSDPITMYLEDIYTVQANICGVPAISVPVGKHSNGLPFGLQLMGKPFDEVGLFDLSKQMLDLV
jgi:aspartyl-tRNA(Asn)/glutamyl-tRNA(Gln) amidotransferase subunit A